MPYIRYVKQNPQRETLAIIDKVVEILNHYASEGYELTLRQVYYQMIARDLFPESWIDEKYNAKNGLPPKAKNTAKNYKRLGNIVSNARESGLIDWDHIVDRARSLTRNTHWDNPTDFIAEVMPQFAIDRWRDQPTRVEVWVEKDALSSVIARACDVWDVPYFACKGYTSSSAIWEAGHRRFLRRYAQRSDYSKLGQKIVVLHLGDHDPSGLDMSRDIEDRLRLFSTRTDKSQNNVTLSVKRIALTMEQIKKYDPPPNPVKDTDSRMDTYKKEYGDDCWELDALEPQVIVEIIQKEIKKIVNKKKFDAATKLESKWRAELIATGNKF